MALPNELLQEIVKNESLDINFLHSCLLVNKSWSINVIPFLWKCPFHLLLNCNKKYSHHIISTYYSCMKNQATYNYHLFLRHLSFFSFLASVQEWCTLNLYENDPFALYLPKKIFSFFAYFTPSLETLDFVFEIECLFKLDENVFKLTNLMNETLFNTMNVILSRDSNVREWISNVKEILLKGDIIEYYDLFMLFHDCRNIKTLKVRLPNINSQHYSYTLEKICKVIELQQNLENFTLYKSDYHLKIGDALTNQKDSLRQIEFSEIEIIGTYYLDWILHCDNLERLIFTGATALPWQFGINQSNQPILKKLKYLVIKDHFCFPTDFAISIIRSSNEELQEIKFEWPKDQQGGLLIILEYISHHCINLTRLGATIGSEEFPTLLVLLKNCIKLKNLEIYGNDKVLDVDGILPKLGLSLPHNLVELIIVANWKFRHDSLLSFFENSKHIQLYKFVIKFCEFINYDHLEVIAKHSMDSLKYITFKDEMFATSDVGIKNASIWLESLKLY